MDLTKTSRRTAASAKPRAKKAKPAPSVLWPVDVANRYGVSEKTRWEWERDGKLPKRDVHIGGEAVAWYVTTIEAAERGPQAVQL